MIQPWYCEECNVSGRCVIPKGAEVYGALHLLVESHAKKSPQCLVSVKRLRVKTLNQTAASWRKFVHEQQEKFAGAPTPEAKP